MNPSPELNTTLKQLRLSGVLDSLEQRNRLAIDGQSLGNTSKLIPLELDGAEHHVSLTTLRAEAQP